MIALNFNHILYKLVYKIVKGIEDNRKAIFTRICILIPQKQNILARTHNNIQNNI